MSKTKITCPVCGTEFETPETTHISVGLVIGKDSNLGEIHPEVAKENKPVSKAQQRIDALKAAGINTDGMFAVNCANGESIVCKMGEGGPVEIDENDPVYKNITEKGTIPDRRLFRRWVMSQVFHLLDNKKGFTESLKQKGYEYQWKMMEEELRVQSILATKDRENYDERHLWLNGITLKEMMEDYMTKLEKQIRELTVRHCKGVPYVRIAGKNVFTEDLNKKFFDPLWKIIYSNKDDYAKCKAFNAKKIKLYWDTPFCKRWLSDYKGAGAFFTLKNLILFHGCSFKQGAVKLSRDKSLSVLKQKAFEFRNEGWKLFAVLKEFLISNNIDIREKRAEWAKEKANRNK